jgi:sugar phosphate isomerase/epimerase
MANLTRRDFLRQSTVAAAALAAARATWGAEPELWPARLGACTGPNKAEMLKAAGAQYFEWGVRSLLVPDKDDEEFAKRLVQAKAAVLPVEACNSFLPNELKCVGPEPKHDDVLAFAGTAFKRAKEAGLAVIVFGSGGARRIPDGFSKTEAENQFVELLKRMGPLAEPYGVTIGIEPLRRQECNFINTIVEGAELAERADHPNVKIIADLYHMLQNGEEPATIGEVGKWIVHTHIAEKAGRTAPGVDGDDFGPFFAQLKAIGYRGRMSIEGKWSDEQMPKAYEVIRAQAG